ncbi:MAG TPA: SusC/RagA family TonB-linked outer membrane protein [Gemmatimonadaceae bacterium]|nr:SusC/RagA family TonB-linked outer membrane protein [Gemmatimonadaceae bacterium]
MNRLASLVDPHGNGISFSRVAARVFLFAALLAPGLVPDELKAQQGVVAGIVTTGATANPVQGATVRVQGTERQALTGNDGRFRIAGLTGGTVTLEVRMVGYRPMTVSAQVGNTDLRVTLTAQSLRLDQVVVTGTAGGQSKRELGTAVSTIDAAATKEIAPINSVQNLLAARAPGVFVNSATGNVGAGARIRIRGASSMSLSNEPLIYVDGVRVASAPATGPANQAFGSSSISRINDINPDDIESIEVIKGPAAATLYGTEASNGVIQIITKRGRSGAPRWSFAMRQGTNYLQNPEGRWPVNYNAVERLAEPGVFDTLSIDIIDAENARGTPVFQSGRLQEYDVSTSGGSDVFTYYAGAGIEDSKGIEPTSSVKRYSSRLNLNVIPSSKFNMSINVGYVNGDVRLPCEAGCGGRTLGTIWANPVNARPLADGSPNPRRGFNSGLPYMYDELSQFWQGVNRFTGGIQLNHEPRAWFRQSFRAGTDRVSEDNNALGLRTDDSLSRVIFGSGALGSRSINTRQVNHYSLDYSASGIWDYRPDLRSTTSFGAQYYRNSAVFQASSGDIFPTVGLTALSATTTNRTTSGDIEEDATLGFYLQEQVGWRDRLFLTAAVRADDNSAFGQNFDRVYYPKFSASWVISEEPFFDQPWVDALKLRAAYGEAGKQPITYSALQTYASASGPGDVATVTPQFLGNADLGPERSKEMEMGFDVGAFGDRLGVEVTYYSKRTTDAIMDRQIAPSIGLPGTQPFNAGAIKNWGTELLVRGRPMERDRFSWETSLSVATNGSRVESLGTPPAILALREASGTPDFVVGGFAIRHQVGYPIGAYFEQRVISAQLLPDGQADIPNVLCDDANGGSMVCAGADLTYGTPDDAPEVYLGRSLPNAEFAFSNTFTFLENFRFYVLIDSKRGFKKLDGNMRSRCAIFERCRENFYPLEFDPKTIAGLQSNGQLVDYYINNSSYTKLREVSLSYTLPAAWSRWGGFSRAVVTVAGRNLHTWTNYPGLEPEAFFLGGSRGGNFGSFEQTTNPQLAQWVFGVNLDW